jgi:hypothetical protein
MFFRKSEKEKTLTLKSMPVYLEAFDGSIVPSYKEIPDWFKKTKRRAYPDQPYHEAGTVKTCVPVLDAMGLGYKLLSPTDFTLTGKFIEDGELRWDAKWKVDISDLITEHAVEQVIEHPLLQNRKAVPLKYNNEFGIITPPGYSTLFTPIINDHFLPMQGIHFMSGVVETDTYPTPINFPFILTNFSGKEIVIKKGTPLLQLIPFKRDDWVTKKETYTKEEREIYQKKFGTIMRDWYKKTHWIKKRFK